MKYVDLNDGRKMPIIGFGVYQITDLNKCEEVVLTALESGYRLIDTAQGYFNEEAVGNALEKTTVKREEIFVTTKVWIKWYGYDDCIKSINNSLKKLKTDYIDLVLVHQAFGDYYSCWRALIDLQKQGKIKSIGVSNMYPDKLTDITLFTGVTPAVNQIEIHPFFQREFDVEWNKKYKVMPQAWGPFAEGKNDIFSNEVLNSIAKKYNKSAAQVILRWFVQRDIPFCVKSQTPERIKQNIDIFDFELSNDDMEAIKTIDTNTSLMTKQGNPVGVERVHSLYINSLDKFK